MTDLRRSGWEVEGVVVPMWVDLLHLGGDTSATRAGDANEKDDGVEEARGWDGPRELVDCVHAPFGSRSTREGEITVVV